MFNEHFLDVGESLQNNQALPLFRPLLSLSLTHNGILRPVTPALCYTTSASLLDMFFFFYKIRDIFFHVLGGNNMGGGLGGGLVGNSKNTKLISVVC